MKTANNNLHTDLPRSSNCMTASGESQKETTGMKLEVMSAKIPELVFGMYVLCTKLENLDRLQQK